MNLNLDPEEIFIEGEMDDATREETIEMIGINIIIGSFSYSGPFNQMQKWHLHAIKDIDINSVEFPPQRNLLPMTFTNDDFKGINPINHDNLMVISIIITNFMVGKVLINQGSSTDICIERRSSDLWFPQLPFKTNMGRC